MSDAPTPRPCRLGMDSRGYLYADGVCLGRVMDTPNGPCLEVKDKNKHRAAKRGTDKVQVRADDLSKAIKGE